MEYSEAKLNELIGSIRPADHEAIIKAKERQAKLAKPPGSLGGLVQVELMKGSSYIQATVINATPNDGELIISQLPADLPPGTDYKIRIQCQGAFQTEDRGDYFEIK